MRPSFISTCLLLSLAMTWTARAAAAKSKQPTTTTRPSAVPAGAFPSASGRDRPGPADPWFLSLDSSRELLRRIQSHGKDTPAALRAAASSAKVTVAKDELGLLVAISELKARKLQRASRAFEALRKAKTPKVAHAARCYCYLLDVRPDGALDGMSLARYPAFLGACRVFAGAEAGRGDALAKKACGMNALTLAAWREAWGVHRQAQAAYGRAAMLDADTVAGRQKLVQKAAMTLASRGLQLLEVEADGKKRELVKALGRLRRAARGDWGPPAAVARANAIMASITKIKAEIQEAVHAACGKQRPTNAGELAMFRTLDEADCLKLPKTAEGERLREQLSQLFVEIPAQPRFVEATGRYLYPNYVLLRIKPIPVPSAAPPGG